LKNKYGLSIGVIFVMSIVICSSLSFSKTAFAQTSDVKVDIVLGASTKSGSQA